MLTAMQSLINHIETDVKLKLLKKDAGERITWYIKTYFVGAEKEQIMKAWVDGNRNSSSPTISDPYNVSDESYYSEKYNNQK